MIDWFVLLTPLLVLPIVLLFVFVGCTLPHPPFARATFTLVDSSDPPASITRARLALESSDTQSIVLDNTNDLRNNPAPPRWNTQCSGEYATPGGRNQFHFSVSWLPPAQGQPFYGNYRATLDLPERTGVSPSDQVSFQVSESFYHRFVFAFDGTRIFPCFRFTLTNSPGASHHNLQRVYLNLSNGSGLTERVEMSRASIVPPDAAVHAIYSGGFYTNSDGAEVFSFWVIPRVTGFQEGVWTAGLEIMAPIVPPLETTIQMPDPSTRIQTGDYRFVFDGSSIRSSD